MFKLFKKMRGDELLKIEKSGSDIDVAYVLKEVRLHGATDNDIREWWNMPDNQLSEMMQEDDDFRSEAYKQWVELGLSKEDARTKLRKSFTIYELYQPGDLHDTRDGNLPYELSPRVSRFFNSVENISKYKAEMENASSMNAFVRDLIKNKVI